MEYAEDRDFSKLYKLLVSYFVYKKKQTRQLEKQRLPGINAAKVRIISESCMRKAIIFISFSLNLLPFEQFFKEKQEKNSCY